MAINECEPQRVKPVVSHKVIVDEALRRLGTELVWHIVSVELDVHPKVLEQDILREGGGKVRQREGQRNLLVVQQMVEVVG